MATESMLREARRWQMWRDQFETTYLIEAANSDEPIDWKLARNYFREGYNVAQSVVKYLELTHNGINS